MGGAGQWMYPNYKDWHPAALTLTIGIKHFGAISDTQFSKAKKYLPEALFNGCDDLAKNVEAAFERVQQRYGSPKENPSFQSNDLVKYFNESSSFNEIMRDLERFFDLMKTEKRRTND